jgi:putative ABC transport system permease protein
MRLLDRSCRAILRLYPAAMRDEVGADMHDTFLQVCAQASEKGGLASIRTALAELLDLATAAVRARTAWPAIPGGVSPRDTHSGKGSIMRSLAHDFRMAVRALAAGKAHTALAVGILAAGIGVNAAVFSIADSLLFRPLPFKDAARFVELWNIDLQGGFSFPGFAPRLVREWRTQKDLFDRVEGYDAQTFVFRGDQTTEMIAGARITPGLLSLLNVSPLHGRLFVDGDGRQGTDRLIVISERLMRSHFGGDPSVVGRSIRLNDVDYIVVGVMPASFHFPYEQQRIWAPFDPDQPSASGAPSRLNAFARLAPGVTAEQAGPQIESRGVDIAKAAGGDGRRGARLGLKGVVDTKTRKSVLSLVGAVGFLLLIVCANLANLSLSRALTRSRDFAVRAALGASRTRLMREAMSESLIVGMLGAAAGLAVAKIMIELTLQAMPEAMTFSRLNDVDLDWRALLFTAAAGLVTAILFGLPPAIAASRLVVADALKNESRSSTGSRASRHFRSALIVAEVSLSVVLLIGAALMTRSFIKLASVDTGFDPVNLISLQLGLPANGYSDPAARDRFTEDFLERVKALPGVTAATAGGIPPDSNLISFGKIETEDRPGVLTKELIVPSFSAWPQYFSTIGIPIRDGRIFGAQEPRESIIVNEGFADELWPGQSAVGKRFRWDDGAWKTIVGVAGEVRQTGIGDLGAAEAKPIEIRQTRQMN